MALCGPGAIGIVGLAGVALAPGVEQGIGGAAVKTLRTMPGLQNAQVGNAAQIEHGQLGMGCGGCSGWGDCCRACVGSCVVRLFPQRLVKHRHQRRALPACGDVAAAKVAGNGDARQLCQQSAMHQLQGVARAVKLARAVAHGLPVRAHYGHLLRGDMRLRTQSLHALGVQAHQGVGGQRRAVQLVVSRLVQRQQFCLQRRRHGRVGKSPLAQTPAVGRCRGRRDVEQHAVHPVHRGARHQADAQKRIRISNHVPSV